MCGIAGFVGPGDLVDLSNMMDALIHRGPDGEGVYFEPEMGLFLGHRRLAIIDIAGGEQPMWDESGQIGVVFNGEIYNHRELRAALEARGHKFQTDHSDTEVLVHGYREWGEDLPAQLNGMFAFCVYDRLRKRLFLARDRFGEKPLYIARQGGLFAFASELTAIAQHSQFSARVDNRSLQKLLAHGFLPAPNAYLENCTKLPGGFAMEFDLTTGSERTWRYWGFRIAPDESWLRRRDDDLAEELRALLTQAVKRRIVADVPLGFFLSGGLDSSAIVAIASQLMPRASIETFTLGFSEESFDETPFAVKVAESLSVRQSVEVMDVDIARSFMPELLSRLDEPSCDASVLPTYFLSQFARRKVTVALSGDGGDELFAGYDPFAALGPAKIYSAMVPKLIHGLLRGAVKRMPPSVANMSLDFKLKRTLAGLSYDRALWNPVWLSAVDPEMMEDLFHHPMRPEELYSEALQVWESGERLSLVDRGLEFYTNFYLQDGILNKVDRATMLNSLESRAPFLDNDLVAFCERLPHQFKMKNGQRKYLLKRAMRGLLPDDIIDRQKKGFGLPTAKWLKSTPAQPPLRAIEGMRMDNVAKAWRDHRDATADHRIFLWGWLSMQSIQYSNDGCVR